MSYDENTESRRSHPASGLFRENGLPPDWQARQLGAHRVPPSTRETAAQKHAKKLADFKLGKR